MTLTSKGQVTLPVALRRQLGIGPGDDLEFELGAEGATLRVVHHRPLAESYGAFEVETVLPNHAAERKAAARKLGEPELGERGR
jgi:AbrB family looped-hinge helix DNA binding protein